MAEAGCLRLLRLPRRANEQTGAGSLPRPRYRPLAALAATTQPKGGDDMGADEQAGRPLAPEAAYPPSLAQCTLRRQKPKVGAGCPNWARPDLCGGRSAMSVPTAIKAHVRAAIRLSRLPFRLPASDWPYSFARRDATASNAGQCPGATRMAAYPKRCGSSDARCSRNGFRRQRGPGIQAQQDATRQRDVHALD
jgi:hypothetical protein